MLLNGSTLNGVTLNGTVAFGASAVPTPIAKALAFRWRLRVMVGGVDMSSRLTGVVSIDRERGAAGVASFVLQLLPGPVVPRDWVGRTVTIHYISTAAGITTEALRYTGRIVRPEWNSLMRLLSCQCGDQLQQRVEALTVAQVDALVGGYWSADVFEPVDGRSRWDYALERLSTLPASLDAAADGALRITSWYAGAADFVFGVDTTVYDTVAFRDADLTSLTNKVELEVDYRFARLWQYNVSYLWAAPNAGGFSGIQGFCTWRHDSSELPDVAMIESATESSGQTLLAGANYARLPPSGAYCDPPAGWTNNYPDLLLGAAWSAGRRWTQSVTEQYRLTVVAEASVSAVGEVIGRNSAALEVESDRAGLWESEAFTDGDTSLEDLRDEQRRVAALECVLRQAATSIIEAHCATVISWDCPTSMVMAVDLTHTLKLDDQGVRAQSRCTRVEDSFDMASGLALTTLSIAVMRGGGTVNDPLRAPAFVPSPAADFDTPDALPVLDGGLPSQLGGRNESPIYDDELDGFAGNYDSTNHGTNPSLEVFPRRFDISAPEIAADKRDEALLPIAATYRVAVPNDLLEL